LLLRENSFKHVSKKKNSIEHPSKIHTIGQHHRTSVQPFTARIPDIGKDITTLYSKVPTGVKKKKTHYKQQ
jgi:hypothetical protein